MSDNCSNDYLNSSPYFMSFSIRDHSEKSSPLFERLNFESLKMYFPSLNKMARWKFELIHVVSYTCVFSTIKLSTVQTFLPRPFKFPKCHTSIARLSKLRKFERMHTSKYTGVRTLKIEIDFEVFKFVILNMLKVWKFALGWDEHLKL